MIAKNKLKDGVWYLGNSERTRIAKWEASKELFVFGHKFPGTRAGFMRLAHAEDPDVDEGFEPTEMLGTQLPLGWTPEQCIRVSESYKAVMGPIRGKRVKPALQFTAEYVKLLDLVASELQLKDDVAIASALDITPADVSKLRNGWVDMTHRIALRIMDRMNLGQMEMRALIGAQAYAHLVWASRGRGRKRKCK